MTKITNCTPHEIVCGEETFKPSGIIPRLETLEKEAPSIGGFPCVTQTMGQVQGLPEPTDGTFLIVSGMVFAASDRGDLIAPDTGKTAVRNDKGHIVAVTRFLRK